VLLEDGSLMTVDAQVYVCSRMLTYVHVCQRMLTYANVC
jgi:hypothetical protein